MDYFNHQMSSNQRSCLQMENGSKTEAEMTILGGFKYFLHQNIHLYPSGCPCMSCYYTNHELFGYLYSFSSYSFTQLQGAAPILPAPHGFLNLCHYKSNAQNFSFLTNKMDATPSTSRTSQVSVSYTIPITF